MSVQLIVFPQNYEGTYNAISNSTTEFIVNGINFNAVGVSSTYSSPSATPFIDTLTNAPPNIVNTWFRFIITFGGTPAFPSVSLGNLILNSVAGTVSGAGVYQRLSNLTIGVDYIIEVNIVAGSSGNIEMVVANGSTPYGTLTTSANTTQATFQFNAQSTDTTVMIAYGNTVVDSLTITSISVQPVIGADPSGAVQILGDGQVICDLYEDEDLPLTLSVDDFKNVAEKVQSYSKAFNLPGTKRNNKIFDRMFEITRSVDGVIFNPYKKTQCILKQDGFILFEGFLRMLDVTDKEGEISYNVNLYSEVVALADFLKDRTFSDLDFSELEHNYNYSNIRNTWQGLNIFPNPQTSGFRDGNTLRYPFVDWNHQFLYDAVGFPVLPNLECAFRPFISIKYLIDRIFEATPFTYESAFFDTSDFNKLFMDFNWGSSTEIIEGDGTYTDSAAPNNSSTTFKNLQLQAGFTNFSSEFGYSPTNFNFVAANNGTHYTFDYSFTVYMFSSDDLYMQWQKKNSSGTIIGVFDAIHWLPTAIIPSTYRDYVGNFTATLAAGDTIQPVFKTGTALTGTQGVLSSNVTTLVNATVGTLVVTTDILLQTLRGELGQWDFLKGLITMFNLVTLPDEENTNNINIEPYTDVFIPTATSGTTLANRGIQHDWTEKIDISEIKLNPLGDLNKKTFFKFVEDDDDYAFTQYKKLVGGHLYGSKKYNAGNEFNILEGTDEIVAEPFAATVVKPLMSQYSDFIVPSLYSYSPNDDTSEAFDNSPRIMFNNGAKTLTSCTYNVPAQNGVGGDTAEDEFLQFSHLSTIPTSSSSIDFHFGECQLLPGVGSPTTNNLFNMYWLPYYGELYNPNTRTMTIKVNLSPSDISTFKFNDKIFIKNRIFRVNKIDYKPNDLATVEFILIP